MSKTRGPTGILDAVDHVFSLVAAACMMLIMLVVVADVVLRYFFAMPLAWSYDVISLYLMVGMFFFGVSDTLRENGHIGIDILQRSMPAPMRHIGEAAGYLLSAMVTAAIGWLAFQRSLSAWQNDEALSGAYLWPTWIALVPVVIGGVLLTLRNLLLTATHLRDAFGGAQGAEHVSTPNLEERI
ncbi:TRAP transporter small permease [Azospirillum sp. TSA2s]|uniref:TRAP transporter small permease n=1 Tax=Azospirillum sp. TSA2s TaxID=709810 RepID=UPI0010AA2943|nr:TRAP transporter small permease subunit [Azospirillum sp. TSA2s]QCG93363.1 TRAP transporter small permease [Azospirillum sp. TSA2s]